MYNKVVNILKRYDVLDAHIINVLKAQFFILNREHLYNIGERFKSWAKLLRGASVNNNIVCACRKVII